MAATRWGIASTGRISFDFTNALRIHSIDKHQVVAVASRNLASAQEFAKKFDIPNAYGSYEEMAKNKDIDIVYVGSIHPQHYPLAEMYILSGKHVLSEKPLTMCKSDTEKLIALARKEKKFLMEGFWTRFFPAFAQMREELAKGTIGDIVQIDANFGTLIADVPRINTKELGGSATRDLGGYPIHVTMMVMGGEAPQRITARGNLFESGVDSNTTIILEFSGNRNAVLTCNARCTMDNVFTVYGTKGKLQVPNWFHCGTVLITPDQTFEFPVPKAKLEMNFLNSEGFFYEQEAVRECLLKGQIENEIMPHSQTIQIAAIMDEAIRQVGGC